MPRGRKQGELVGPYGYRVGGTPLSRERVAAGLTQADLAALAGVSERTVRSLEAEYPCTRRGRHTLEKLRALLKRKV